MANDIGINNVGNPSGRSVNEKQSNAWRLRNLMKTNWLKFDAPGGFTPQNMLSTGQTPQNLVGSWNYSYIKLLKLNKVLM